MLLVAIVLVATQCVEAGPRARNGERYLLQTRILPQFFAARPFPIGSVTQRMEGLCIGGAKSDAKPSHVGDSGRDTQRNYRPVFNQFRSLSSMQLDSLSKRDIGNILRDSIRLYEIYINVIEAQESQSKPLSNDEALKILGLGVKYDFSELPRYFLNVSYSDKEELTEAETEKFLVVVAKKIVPQLISGNGDHKQMRKIRYIWSIFVKKFHQEFKCYYGLDPSSTPLLVEFIDIEHHESVVRKIKSGYYSTLDRVLTKEDIRKILEAVAYILDLQWETNKSRTRHLFRDGHQFVKEEELEFSDPSPFANPDDQLTGAEAMFLVNWYFTDMRDELLNIYWPIPNSKVFGCTEEEIRLVLNVLARKLLHDFIAQGRSPNPQFDQEEVKKLKSYRYRHPANTK